MLNPERHNTKYTTLSLFSLCATVTTRGMTRISVVNLFNMLKVCIQGEINQNKEEIHQINTLNLRKENTQYKTPFPYTMYH